MMDFQRIALLGGIFGVLFLLLLQWNKFEIAQTPASPAVSQETLSSDLQETKTADSKSVQPEEIPISSQVTSTDAHATAVNTNSASELLVSIETDVLKLKIDRHGGDLVMIALPTFSADLATPNIPFELLNLTNDKTYIAQSGLIGKNGTDNQEGRPLFDSAKNDYALQEGESTLTVDFNLPEKDGVKIIKRFTFHRGEHLIDISYLINNNGKTEWQAAFFGQIKRDGSIPKSSAAGMKPFLGMATTTSENHYEKMTFKKIESAPLKNTVDGGWIAMVQHYFISAWIANSGDTNTFTARKLKDQDMYILGYTAPTKNIPANSSGEITSRFYAGPKDTRRLEQIAPYLDLTVDYGWLWWVAKPIHLILQKAHLIIPNWGWCIIVLTIMIKIILFPLSHKAYISMGHMRKVAPKMAAIKEQCGDNRQKLQEEMLKLYKTEKINPMGGCLPMLLQMPVFISLYWVLMESVELRHAPFMGWIHDLSVMDPWFCLPILMGISMFLQQKMNPAPPDPMQAKVMQFLPMVFTFMFLWFPAGLVLYWLVNNITSMAHQFYINKLVARGDA